MKNKHVLEALIKAIKASEQYEGNYGYSVGDASAVLSRVDGPDRTGVPGDYLAFLSAFGFGELDAAFHLDDGPEHYSMLSGREVAGDEGLYVFGGNQSDLLYAFDSKNGWQVVQISCELDEVEPVASNFSDFILEKLTYINALVEWRAANECSKGQVNP